MSIVRLTVSFSEHARVIADVANLNLSFSAFSLRFVIFVTRSESPRRDVVNPHVSFGVNPRPSMDAGARSRSLCSLWREAASRSTRSIGQSALSIVNPGTSIAINPLPSSWSMRSHSFFSTLATASCDLSQNHGKRESCERLGHIRTGLLAPYTRMLFAARIRTFLSIVTKLTGHLPAYLVSRGTASATGHDFLCSPHSNSDIPVYDVRIDPR
jgi:hypothetical protein